MSKERVLKFFEIELLEVSSLSKANVKSLGKRGKTKNMENSFATSGDTPLFLSSVCISMVAVFQRPMGRARQGQLFCPNAMVFSPEPWEDLTFGWFVVIPCPCTMLQGIQCRFHVDSTILGSISLLQERGSFS